MSEECCGTCKWHCPFAQDRFMCTNENSYWEDEETSYSHYCDDWESRED